MRISDLIYEKITSLSRTRNKLITKDICYQLTNVMGAEKALDYISWLLTKGKKEIYDKNKIPFRVGDILKYKIEQGFVDTVNQASKFSFMQVGQFGECFNGGFVFRIIKFPVPIIIENCETHYKGGYHEHCDDTVRKDFEIVYMSMNLGRDNIKE